MHLYKILRFTGTLIFFLGLSMILPFLVALWYDEPSARSILYSMIISCSAGLILYFATRGDEERTLTHRDGVAIVTIGWVAAALFSAVPFMLSGTIPHFTNAYFETLSGLTTTGASILSDIESLPRGILIWRSLIQWLGGMGIIVLSIAILPFLGVGGMQLYKAEVPSPVVDKLKPRISDTAKVLWKVYILLTFVEIFLLVAGDMPLFDAVNHTFCTMPTGGFSTKNASIAFYKSPYIDGIVIVFMLLASVNFSLHYKFLKGDPMIFHRDPECRVFLMIVAFFIIAVTVNLYFTVYPSIGTAFRYAAFQVSSIISTTGFVTADFDRWPGFSQIILVLCMFLGGMAGSTAGGIKTMRIILLWKHAYLEIFRIIHPHAVTSLKLGGKPVPQEVMSSIWGFTLLYLAIFVISALIISSLGLDAVSAFTAVSACVFNVGPGLGTVGPTQNFLAVPFLGKWVLIFCMLVGRLEIYTVLVLMMPEFWRK